jgi:hypothetical protein
MINNNKCNCGASFEDVIHYFLECSLYLNERRTLLSHCDDININIETLLFDVNSQIFGKVRTFINQSKRYIFGWLYIKLNTYIVLFVYIRLHYNNKLYIYIVCLSKMYLDYFYFIFFLMRTINSTWAVVSVIEW